MNEIFCSHFTRSFWLLSFTFLASITTQAEVSSLSLAPLYLEVGEQRSLEFPQLERFSVSGNGVHYVRIPKENQILLKAIKPGSATLTVISKLHRTETLLIRVEQKKTFQRPNSLLQALNSLRSTEVIDQGDRFVLRGTVSQLPEAQAIASLVEKYPNHILDDTRIETSWLERNQREILALISSYPSLSFSQAEGGLSVSGGLPHSYLKDSLVRKIKAIQPLTHIEIQTISDQNPTVYFKVFLLEVKKALLTSLGVNWANPNGALLQVSPTQFLMNNTVDLSINTLSQEGMIRVLSSPELVVRAPGQAELFAGGELPIRQTTKFAESVVWKNVGLSLKLDVKEFGGEKVRLNIETEMSHLDEALSNDRIPGIQSNRMKTQVDGTMGKPLLLSGLLQEDLRHQVKGLPWLMNLPIIGKLFGSEDYQKDRSELVAVLLPHREPPKNPQLRISSDLPKGYLPLPRTSLSAEEQAALKQDRNFPWNVL